MRPSTIHRRQNQASLQHKTLLAGAAVAVAGSQGGTGDAVGLAHGEVGREARSRLPGHCEVLQLDINGVPQDWIKLEIAAGHYATGQVAWFDGASPLAVFRGGFNSQHGRQSQIEIHPIIALRGCAKINLYDVEPSFSKSKLVRRDRFTCAYCGEAHREQDLQIEHILPQSRGGPLSWQNCVSACGPCNLRKRDRTPEEAGMPLLFVPYQPSRYEDFLLNGRNIRADVHEWLASRLPKGSRLS